MELLTADRVRIHAHGATRDEALEKVASMLEAAGAVTSGYLDGMRRREELATTCMGAGLAIPHGDADSSKDVHHAALVIVRYDGGVDWSGEPVRFVVGLAGKGDVQLELLGRIAVLFDDEQRVARLERADTPAALHALLTEV